ncbi:MAG: prolipoprotein diacylglyceryl transferase [Flavobacteriales bacterium]|nr:prolipoprotein diacylglyceryl transferase [Flavobacteriales bacterium]
MAEQQESKAGWVRRLAERWGVSPARVGVILLVFALTGFTVMFLKKPMVAWASGDAGDPPLLFTVLYYILILPVYNALLLLYGALFGQFSFFWAFEKRFFARLFGRRKP